MPNLKDIRRRIKSVKSTQKITQAMKMVAAAKVKRAENRVKASRPYAKALRSVFTEVYEGMKNQASELDGSKYASLLSDRPVKNVGIVAIASDKGLCGSYNATVMKQLLAIDSAHRKSDVVLKLYLVGNKIIRSFPNFSDTHLLGTTGDVSSAPTVADASAIAETLFEAYHNGEIDAVQILYTEFVSMISYKVTLKPVFPLKGIIEEVEHIISSEAAEVDEKASKLETRAQTVLEPNPVEVLDTLIPAYLGNEIYIAMLEGAASELAARMTAMSNASNNAAEMIDRLTLDYNKARQASITQEILEIVGGAEALN